MQFKTNRCIAVLSLMTVTFFAHGQSETFTSDEAVRPHSFSKEDEKFLRDFSKGMSGRDLFNANMEIPYCQMRAPLKTLGAYFDGFTKTSSYGAYIRIPVETSAMRLQALALPRKDLPRQAFLELVGDLPTGKTQIEWTQARLVVPPLSWAGSHLGPDLAVATVQLNGYSMARPKVWQAPALPAYVELRGFPKAITTGDGSGSFSATLEGIAPAGDSTSPRVLIDTRFPRLAEDLTQVSAMLADMRERNRNSRCEVLERDCRDGDCR